MLPAAVLTFTALLSNHVIDAILSSAHAHVARKRDLPMRDIFLLAGQSNAVGLGKNGELHGHYAEFPENMLVYPRRGVSQFTDFASFKDNGGPTSINANEQFGPEVSFGNELAHKLYNQSMQESFGLVKDGSMGTSLYEHWNPDGWLQLAEASDPRWSGEVPMLAQLNQRINFSVGDYGGQFIQLVRDARSAVRSQVCEEHQCHVRAMIWIQGEADAENMQQAPKYGERLEKMVHTMRTALGLPELLVLIAQISSKFPGPGVATVTKAQQAFVKSQGPKLARLVSAEDIDLYADNIHYSTEGQLELGRRLAATYIETLQQQ